MSRIAIVGGGFAGLYAAYRLSRAGYTIVLYEEHGRVGLPMHCTGLVSSWVVERIGRPARSVVRGVYHVYRMRADGIHVDLRLGEPSYKLDRVRLEYNLLDSIVEAGGEARLGCRVSRVYGDGDVVSCDGRHRFDAVIVAPGLYGLRRGDLVPPPIRARTWEPRIVWGVNVEAGAGDSPGAGVVVIDLDGWRGGFFYWNLETRDGVLAGGALSSGPPAARVIVSRYRLRDAERVYGGPILTGPPHPRPWWGRVFLLGDAAGHNKPLTGGGLFPTVYTVECMAGRDVDEWAQCIRRTRKMLLRQLPLARLFQGRLDRDEVVALLKAVGGVVRVRDFDRHETLLEWEGIGRWIRGGLSLAARKPWAALKVASALASSIARSLA